MSLKFDTRTPLMEKGPGVGIHRSHIKYFTDLTAAVNAAPQIVTDIPANSAAPGSAGQTITSGGFYYVHDGTQWLRTPLVSF